MEADYGVGITNRYAFLVDDVEELEVLDKKKDEKVPQPVKSAKKKAVAVLNAKDKELKAKTAKSTSTLETQKGPGRDDPSRERGGSRGRGGRGGADRVSANTGYKSEDFNDPDGGGEGFEVAGGRGMRTSGRGRGGISRGGGRSMYGQEDRGNKENYYGSESNGGRGGRGGGVRRGGGYQPRNNFEPNGEADENGYEDSRVERGNGGAGGREFFARGRGPRGGGRGGRRDYDRQSGSDKSSVKPMDKREGGGAHNWGSYKDDDDMKAETTSEEKVEEDGNADEMNNGSGAGDGNTAVETADMEEDNGTQHKTPLIEQEPEPKTLTLGEWKAMQQPRTTPQFNIRKPNDGEDPTKWKHLVLRKKNNLDDDEDQYEEGEDIWVPQRAGRLQRITDIGFHFEDDRPNDRGFRRGPKQFRSGGQNDRQFGRMREPRPPKVDDENDFPTL